MGIKFEDMKKEEHGGIVKVVTDCLVDAVASDVSAVTHFVESLRDKGYEVVRVKEKEEEEEGNE